MLHLALHVLVPLAVAFAWYRDRPRKALLVMLATMAVDADHLLADPIYDPARCSIGFHPLHTAPAVALYFALWLVPVVAARRRGEEMGRPARAVHLVGLGLVIHMVLDALDCLI